MSPTNFSMMGQASYGSCNASGAGWRLPLCAIIYAVAYYAAAKFSVATSVRPENLAVLWPANAVLLYFLLSSRLREWPVYFALTVPAEVLADLPTYSLGASVGYAFVNMVEATVTAALLMRFAATELSSLRNFAIFAAAGPVFAAAVAAMAGAAIHTLTFPEIDFAQYWRIFWFSDGLGLLIVGTALLLLPRRDEGLAVSVHKIAEAVLLGALLTATLIWAASLSSPQVAEVYLVFLFLLWSAARFGSRATSGIIVVITIAAVWATAQGLGPFAAAPASHRAEGLQALLATLTVSGLTISFTIEELRANAHKLRLEVISRQAAEASLQRSYRQLEQAKELVDLQVAMQTRELRQALARNTILLKEVHHRVKNNLHLVSGMLRLHSRSVPDEESRQKGLELQRRINAIAEVYDLIHRLEGLEQVDLTVLVKQLVLHIGEACGVAIDVVTRPVKGAFIPTDMAVGLALAINELITNSLKHSKGRPGSIVVTCTHNDEQICVRVADDGPGFPPDFVLEQATGFGTRMVREMVRRAGGTINLPAVSRGAAVEITIPVANAGGGAAARTTAESTAVREVSG